MNHHSSSRARREPVTERGRQARLKLLRAAEKVFGEKGYEDASIADICREAGAALGSFYMYFPDKREAFVELVDSLGQRLRHALADAVKSEPDRLSKERAGLLAFFEFLGEHKELYRIVRQAEFVDEAAFRRYYDRLSQGYVEGLRSSIANGEIRKVDVEITSYCLMGMSSFLGMRWQLWEKSGAKTAVKFTDAAMDLITHGLAAGAATPKKRVSASPKKRSKSHAS